MNEKTNNNWQKLLKKYSGEQYNFYPFNSEECVWKYKNKAIVKYTPYEKLPKPLRDQHQLLREFLHDYYCGYVLLRKEEVPSEWLNDKRDIDSFDMIDVHGGVTFKDIQNDFIVIGFDCCHAFDDENIKLQDINYIIELTQQMEDQLRLHLKNIREIE